MNNAPTAAADSLRYALADALYVAEGRYGTLEMDIRNGLDDLDTSGWGAELERVRAEVAKLLADEHDDGRRSGCERSLRLIGELSAELQRLAA